MSAPHTTDRGPAAAGGVAYDDVDRPDTFDSAHSAVTHLHAARTAATAAVTDLVCAAGGLPLALACDEEVAETLLDLVEMRRRAEAAIGDVAARFAGTTMWSAEGFRSPRDWLGAHTNEGPGLAGRTFETGSWLPKVPVMADAFRAGAVTRVHVEALIEAHRLYPRLSETLSSIETEVVEHARHMAPKRFRSVLLARLMTIDPQAIDDAHAAKRRDSVGLHVSRMLDGFFRIDGVLNPEVGQQLLNALDSARDKIRNRDAAKDQPTCTCEAGAVCLDEGHRFALAISESASRRLRDTPSEAQPRLSSRNVEALGVILDAAASLRGSSPRPASR